MKKKKMLTVYVDEEIAKELEEKSRYYQMSVNRFINEFLKNYLLDYTPPKVIIQRHLRVLEKYIENEEEKNNDKITALNLSLKVIDPTTDDETTKAKIAKIEEEISTCRDKAKILNAKKMSIEIISEKLEYFS